VGKTFAMLNEGWRRKSRGTDVVVGYVEDHGRPNTAAQVRDLEVVPRRHIEYRGQSFEEMDTDGVIARKPAVALVDELAHTNVPGCRNQKRWQDVEELLDAGINVISTVNIQHLESLNDVVQRITGVVQRETIPDAAVRAADQVELVDMAPEALRRRMAHGNIYAADQVDAALSNYFRVGNLAALRELALLWVADKVDEGLQDYRERHGIASPWETKERVVVALTGSPQGERLIRRAARMAARSRAELVGVHIRSADGLARPSSGLIEKHRSLLVELGGRYEEISSSDVPQALVSFARAQNATQLVLGATRRSRWAELIRGSVINQVIREAADGIDVHVISSPTPSQRPVAVLPKVPMRGHLAVLPRRNVVVGWVMAIVGMPLFALLLTTARGTIGETGALPLLLLGVIAVAAVGGLYPGVVGALLGFAFADWYFIPPIHSLTVDHAGDVIALVVFLVVAVAVSLINDQLARRRLEVARARSEAEALARLAGGALISGPEALPQLTAELRSTFGLDAVAVLTPATDRAQHEDRGWKVLASAGAPVPASPDGAPFSVELGDGAVLVLAGSALEADDRRLLTAFVAQLRLVREQSRLKDQAASAERLAEANELRTALLAAVSHDLRTPLASIKASATSLLSDDVTWSPDAVKGFCHTISAESDRLNTLVGNLLDMSRLQTGALHLAIRRVGLEEVTYAALASLSRDATRVSVDVPETLPRVDADPALLERAVANLVDNALNWSPPDRPVRVEAGMGGDRIDLRVVDRGPGIPAGQREAVFQPFQRLGDGGSATREGVGLGLAVAKGFVEAMGGELTLEDTPGGGVTAIISLPVDERDRVPSAQQLATP
jgi:two-component system sensor histidine kinase KdpD